MSKYLDSLTDEAKERYKFKLQQIGLTDDPYLEDTCWIDDVSQT